MSAVDPLHATRVRAPSIGTSARNVRRVIGVSALAAVGGYALDLAALPVVIHRVGSGVFGAWAAIASLLAIGALADAGTRGEMTRRVSGALGRGDDNALREAVHSAVGILLVIGGSIALPGLLLAPLIRLFAFPRGIDGYSTLELDWILRITLILLATSLVVDGYLATLRGIQRSDLESRSSLISLFPGVAATLGAAYAGWGLWALLVGACVEVVSRWGLQWQALRKLLPDVGVGVRWPTLVSARGFLTFSSLILLSQLGDVVDSQWDKLVLSRFVDTSAVAAFQLGTNVVSQMKVLALLPLIPLLSAVSELRERDAALLERTYSMLSRASAVVAACVLSVVFVAGPSFMVLWLGREYASTLIVIRLFACAVALNLMCAAAAIRCIGQGWHRIAAASAISNIAVNGVLSFIFAAVLGLRGPLIGSIAGNAAGLVAFQVLLARRSRERWTLPVTAPFLFGAAVSAGSIAAGVDDIHSWMMLVGVCAALTVATATAGAALVRLPVRGLLAGGLGR